MRASLLDFLNLWLKNLREEAKDRGQKIRLSLKSLTVLSPQNDPFRVGTPLDHAEGKWLKDQLDALGITQLHFRGIHYRLIGAIKPDGTVYENNDKTWEWLQSGPGKAARWLRYIDFERIIDERNAAPTILIRDTTSPSHDVTGDVEVTLPTVDDFLPTIVTNDFVGCQAYRLALFGEKSSLATVLRPISNRFNTDLFLPTGELSDTMIYLMAKAAAEDGRPCVVFYISDCDPSGWQMSISLCRKLQALKVMWFPDLDIRVYRVALTPDQVRALGLPSTPLKLHPPGHPKAGLPTDPRAVPWKAAMGLEQTEVDAVLPADLRDIVVAAVEPWFDGNLDENVADAEEQWRADAQQVLDDALDPAEVEALHADADTALPEMQAIIDRLNAAVTVPDDIDLPEIEIPEPEYWDLDENDENGEPLFHTLWNIGKGTLRLQSEKRYENGDDEE